MFTDIKEKENTSKKQNKKVFKKLEKQLSPKSQEIKGHENFIKKTIYYSVAKQIYEKQPKRS